MHLEQSEKQFKFVRRCKLDVTFSLSVSKADVASSNNKIVGFLMSALAIATLCFCPPDKWLP